MRKVLFVLVLLVLVLIATGCVDSYTKATGGGWISVDGGKATFGFNAHLGEKVSKDCYEAKGQFQFNDHTSDVKLHGSVEEICDFLSFRYIAGTYVSHPNGDEGTFSLYVEDHGEPGIGGDYFNLWLDGKETDYQGELVGGNIQVTYK